MCLWTVFVCALNQLCLYTNYKVHKYLLLCANSLFMFQNDGGSKKEWSSLRWFTSEIENEQTKNSLTQSDTWHSSFQFSNRFYFILLCDFDEVCSLLNTLLVTMNYIDSKSILFLFLVNSKFIFYFRRIYFSMYLWSFLFREIMNDISFRQIDWANQSTKTHRHWYWCIQPLIYFDQKALQLKQLRADHLLFIIVTSRGSIDIFWCIQLEMRSTGCALC